MCVFNNQQNQEKKYKGRKNCYTICSTITFLIFICFSQLLICLFSISESLLNIKINPV